MFYLRISRFALFLTVKTIAKLNSERNDKFEIKHFKNQPSWFTPDHGPHSFIRFSTRMMFYHGSDKKRHKDQVRKVAFTLQFLGDRTNFSFTAHVISEIVTQTDVRIKKRVRTRVFSGFGAIDVKTRKNTGPCPSPKIWYGLFVRSVLLFCQKTSNIKHNPPKNLIRLLNSRVCSQSTLIDTSVPDFSAA